MALQRTHILLESEQQRLLAEVARREGRSVSDVTRQILQEGIQQRQEAYQEEQNRRLEALANAERVRKAILDERHGKPFEIDLAELIREMREQRNDELLQRGS